MDIPALFTCVGEREEKENDRKDENEIETKVEMRKETFRTDSSMASYTSNAAYHDKLRAIILGLPCTGLPPEPSQLLPHLYIGSQNNAEDLALLRKIGITHVVNCGARPGGQYRKSPYEGLGIDYLEFEALDDDGYDITQHFAEATRYLDYVKARGAKALVHCALGINRSAAICVGYLMSSGCMPLLKAVQHMKKKRKMLLSNKGFQIQLVRYARSNRHLDSNPQDYKFLELGQVDEEMEQRVESLQSNISRELKDLDSYVVPTSRSQRYSQYDDVFYDESSPLSYHTEKPEHYKLCDDGFSEVRVRSLRFSSSDPHGRIAETRGRGHVRFPSYSTTARYGLDDSFNDGAGRIGRPRQDFDDDVLGSRRSRYNRVSSLEVVPSDDDLERRYRSLMFGRSTSFLY